MTASRTVQLAAFALVISLYAAARIWGMTGSCLWFDEIFSIHAAEHPWNSIFSFVSLDLIHPPLFYVLLKLWISIGGESLLWLRSFPVAISVIAVFPFIALCRELKLSVWTQILALFLFAVNGSLIKYAQEVRMYSLLLCLSLFSMWLFVRFVNRGVGYVPLIIVNVLMVYTHYFGWLVVLTEVGLVLWFQRTKLREALIMAAIAAAAFLPWIIAVASAALGGSDVGQNIGWMSRPGPTEIFNFVLDVVEPFYYQASSAEPSSYFVVSIPIVLLIGAAKLGYLTKERSESDRCNFSILGAFTGIPIAIALIVSWLTPYSIWGTRHLIIAFPPMLILSAVFLTGIDNKTLSRIAATCLGVLVAIGFAVNANRLLPDYSWCVWEPLTKDWILAPHYSSEPKQVFVTEELIGYHIWFAARKFPGHKIDVIKGIPGTSGDPAYFLPRGFDEVKVIEPEAAFSASEFWVAFRDPDPDHDAPGIPFISRLPRVISELGRLGFEPEDVRKERVGNESVFFAKMVRRPAPDP
ncbi:hypothetical protein BH20ACI2_BH20ACI2_21210 [soil metagenome]